MPSFHSRGKWNIRNISRDTSLAHSADVADSFISRLCGLIPRNKLTSGEGLIITRCKSIHMLFMKFSIDAVFVDKTDKVVGIVEHIKPNQFSRTFWRSSYVIELPPGTVEMSQTEPGDQIEFFPQNVS